MLAENTNRKPPERWWYFMQPLQHCRCCTCIAALPTNKPTETLAHEASFSNWLISIKHVLQTWGVKGRASTQRWSVEDHWCRSVYTADGDLCVRTLPKQFHYNMIRRNRAALCIDYRKEVHNESYFNIRLVLVAANIGVWIGDKTLLNIQ